MNPIAAVQAIIACVIALIIGLVAGYVYGHQSGAAEHLPAITSLKGSVDSCNVAAAAANATVEADRIDGVAREERIEKALADNVAIVAAATKQRTGILTKPLRGGTECEQVINAVNDHFRGGKP